MGRAWYGLLFAVALGGFYATVAVADTFSSILVLGVTVNDRDDDALAQNLSAHLSRTGKVVVSNRHLTHEEKRASAQEALEVLAGREKTQLLLSAAVTLNKGDSDGGNKRNDYFVTISLYDAVHHRAVPIIKDLCQSNDLGLCVDELADKSINQARDKGTSSAGNTSAAGSAADSDAAKSIIGITTAGPSGPVIGTGSGGNPLSVRRKVIIGIFGGLAVLTLGTAIGLTVIDGTPREGTCSYQSGPMVPRCIWDTRAGYGIAYAGTAVLVGGALLTWLLPDSTNSTKIIKK